jgi:hypothetical protein
MAEKTRKWRRNQSGNGRFIFAPSEPFCGHSLFKLLLIPLKPAGAEACRYIECLPGSENCPPMQHSQIAAYFGTTLVQT